MTQALDPVRAHPHERPQLYPLIQRTWRYDWWRPVLGIIAMVAGAVILVPLALMPLLAVALTVQGGPGSFQHRWAQAAGETVVSPASFLYLNLSLAAVVLLAWAIQRGLHGLRPRWLMSVKPGIRWRFFLACLGLAVIAIVVNEVVGSLLPTGSDVSGGHVHPLTSQGVAFIVLVLLTTPLQAMGEEYGFRGYLMQAFGGLTDFVASRWVKDRAAREKVAVGVALVVTATLFALAHGAQNFPLFFDRFAFGLLAGYLVVRTGGLEAGIALHIWNNLVSFGFAIAYHQMTQTLTPGTASWWVIPLTVVEYGVYLVLVIVVARRMGLDNRTRPPVLVQETTSV